ncbi:MAG: alpha/beta hydrolase [Desulfobacterales bacterium]|nr:alpha/beta hydrolase [Desulfobacterales bacterium]
MDPEGFFFTTHDGLKIRYGIWRPESALSRASVVYLAGRAEFLEKNRETITGLRKRGFAVYSFDWRGQGLSSRILDNPHKGYVRSFADYVKDLNAFVSRIAKPDPALPKILLAHSMGGNIGMQYLNENPGFFDRAVLVSPMFDINTFPFPRGLTRKLVQRAVRTGRAERYIPGDGDYPFKPGGFRGNALTGDPNRFLDEIREVRKNPDLALGGVTFGWAAAAFDAIDCLSAPGYVEAVKTPVLLASGTRDRVVDTRSHQRICSRLSCCRLLKIQGARHEILKETDVCQQVFWQAFDRFTAC